MPNSPLPLARKAVALADGRLPRGFLAYTEGILAPAAEFHHL